jgi:hypothetical protein
LKKFQSSSLLSATSSFSLLNLSLRAPVHSNEQQSQRNGKQEKHFFGPVCNSNKLDSSDFAPTSPENVGPSEELGKNCLLNSEGSLNGRALKRREAVLGKQKTNSQNKSKQTSKKWKEKMFKHS